MPDYRALHLEDVNIDYAAQPRDSGLDADHVADLEAAYQDGKAVEPPVVWFFPDQTYWLSQGYHRITAAKRAGLKEMKFAVRMGTPDEWYEDTQASNKDHGLKRSNADKRKAAVNMVSRFPNRSDRAIAEKLGLDHKTVSEARRLVGSVGEIPQHSESAPKRTGQDGREYNATKPPKAPAEKTTTHTSTEKTKTTEPPPSLVPPPAPVVNPAVETVMCPHCLGAGRIPKPKPAANLYDAPGMPPLPANLDTAEFIIAWESWLHDRKKRGKKVQPNAATLQLRDLSAHGQKIAIEAIETSIKNGWTGLFPGKVGTNGQHNNGRGGRAGSTVRVNGAPGDFDDTAPALS